MGFSPFTQLDLTPASRSFLRQELTHNGCRGIAVLPKNAHKPRFSHQKLPFERFQYRVQPWHRRLVPTTRLCAFTAMPERRLGKEPVISIVDDDQFVRDSLKRLMKSFGYMATAHPSAGDFLNSPQLEKTSCLIADVNMSGMTGVELFEYLLKAGRSIPTILITAYPDDRVRTRAIDQGVLAYLVKPFSETDLTRYVRFALESDSPKK